MRNYYIFISALSIFVVVLLTIGFTQISNPFLEKAKKLDQQRVTDLQSISYAISNYNAQNYKLPGNLSEIKLTSGTSKTTDPETNKKYDYKIISASEYELCATFGVDTQIKPDVSVRATSIVQPPQTDIYATITNEHPKGEYCYKLTVQNYGGYIYPTPVPYNYAPPTDVITPTATPPYAPSPTLIIN